MDQKIEGWSEDYSKFPDEHKTPCLHHNQENTCAHELVIMGIIKQFSKAPTLGLDAVSLNNLQSE